MGTGILSGLFWAMETVLIGQVMHMEGMSVLFLTPFVCTFLHDAFSAIWMFAYNHKNGQIQAVRDSFQSRNGKFVSLAAIIGGPVGMSGYMMTIHYLGSSMGAVVSAIFPAIGALLAVLFLKEKMKWYQWVFLFLTLLGVYGINYSSSIEIVNVSLGFLGAFLCAFGWGMEAVILAKCLKSDQIRHEHALQIRQTTSALVYGLVLLPFLMKFNFMALFWNGRVLLLIGVAALFATVSYLFYYKAIYKVGASKAMALNITYVAWSIVLTVVLFQDFNFITPMTLGCSVLVFGCGILTTFDFKRKIV